MKKTLNFLLVLFFLNIGYGFAQTGARPVKGVLLQIGNESKLLLANGKVFPGSARTLQKLSNSDSSAVRFGDNIFLLRNYNNTSPGRPIPVVSVLVHIKDMNYWSEAVSFSYDSIRALGNITNARIVSDKEIEITQGNLLPKRYFFRF